MPKIHSVIDIGKGFPVVLLHGFPEYAGVWRHQIDALSSRYRAIAPNLPGFNDRGCAEPSSLSASQVAKSLLRLLDERGLAQAIVVGHDMGGLIAWWLASAHPERIVGLATLSSPHPADFLECLRTPTQRRRSAYIAEFISDPPSFFDPDRLSQWIPDAKNRAKLRAVLLASDPTSIAAYYRSNLGPACAEIWSSLERVRCPALVMFGDADPYIDVACFKNVASRVSGPLRLEVLAGKGHFLHTSEAEMVSALLLSWVEGLVHD